MIRDKKMVLTTSLVTLLPILYGLSIWDRLPRLLVTHWNVYGYPDGFTTKSMAVFGLPLFMLFIHLICIVATSLDPKSDSHDKAVYKFLFWICPALSVFVSSIIYAYAIGMFINTARLAIALIGLMFIAIGKLIAECKQNYTIGIRTPWTLNDPDVWDKTHAFAAKVFNDAGVLMMFFGLMGWYNISFIVIFIAALIPVIYSYKIHPKQQKYVEVTGKTPAEEKEDGPQAEEAIMEEFAESAVEEAPVAANDEASEESVADIDDELSREALRAVKKEESMPIIGIEIL